MKGTTGVELNPDWLFDIQVKRIHEYKRQHLNVLHIVTLYHRLKNNPGLDIPPRAFIFGGKAAPGYFVAKRIIKLINAVAETVNGDPDVNRFMTVAFVPNFNVQNAHLIYPAADLSEQISTAGKEASGTGNMKFMINGALTIGTLDGANVEMRDEAGAENFFLFGLTEDQVQQVKRDGYRPMDYVDHNEELKAVLQLIAQRPLLGRRRGRLPSLGGQPAIRRPVPGARRLRVLHRMPEPGQRSMAGHGRVDADVDPEHRAQRQVLLRPGHRGVLRRDLERPPGDGQGGAVALSPSERLAGRRQLRVVHSGHAVDGDEIGSRRPRCARVDPRRRTVGIARSSNRSRT